MALAPHLLPLPALSAFSPKLSPSISPFFPTTHHKSHFPSLSQTTSISFSSVVSKGRSGFSNSASNNRRTGSSFDDDDDDEEEEEKGEEKSMLSMPLHEMQRWYEKKPLGFGEGKSYDTSIEDEIVEEMEQGRKAQLANINKLKHMNSPQAIALTKKKELEMQKALEAVQCGIEVRIGNLPKKKNIHRDLQSAFKSFPGILHITPAVSGNKKTRDPICKGFAFLYLESEEAAQRFVQMYSNQNIQFGKIGKQIACEITTTQLSSKSAAEQSAVSTSVSAPQMKVAKMREENDSDSDVEGLTWESGDETFSEWSAMATHDSSEASTEIIYSMDDEPVLSDTEIIDVGIEDVNITEPNGKDAVRRKSGGIAIPHSVSVKQQKKGAIRKPQNKANRLSVPGAAKRLQIKEKAVLVGVLSKYGGKDDSGKR